MKSIIFLLLFIYQIQSIAGPKVVGNGADVIICKQNSSHKSQLLDLFEMQNILGLQTTGLQGHNIFEISVRLADRLKVIPSFDVEKIKYWIRNFEAETWFIKDVELTNIEDSYHVALPTDCDLNQIAIQKEPELPGDKRYIVNLTLWNQIDIVSKSAMIIHEVIYRQMIQNYTGSKEEVNSLPVRRLVSYILSDSLKKLNSQEIRLLESKLGFYRQEAPSMTDYIQKAQWMTDPVQVSRVRYETLGLYFKNGIAVLTKKCTMINFNPARFTTVTVKIPYTVSRNKISMEGNNYFNSTEDAVVRPCKLMISNELGTNFELINDQKLKFQNYQFTVLKTQ